MYRINQSRKKLTASIAAAAKAEDFLYQAATSTASASERSPLSTNESERKRPREKEQAIDDADGATDEINDYGGGREMSSTPTPSPCKKVATLHLAEVTTTESRSFLSPTSQSDISTTISTITPTPGIVPNPPKVDESIDIPPTDATAAAISTNATTAPCPDTPVMAIDLTTPSSHRARDKIIPEVSFVDLSTNLKPTAPNTKNGNDDEEIQVVSSNSQYITTAKDGQSAIHDDNDGEEEEIQVVSSTTINPNIQYPHKRLDCGLYKFSQDPKKFCDKCYCIVCDVPAKDCPDWEDHSTTKCRPAPSRDDVVADDNEGYDVTDEILLESPTTTARNYYNLQQQLSVPQQEQNQRIAEGRRVDQDAKLRIPDVLSQKLSQKLSQELTISEGGRTSMEKMKTKNNVKSENGKRASERLKNSMDGDIPRLGLHSSFFVEGIKIGWPFPAIMLPQRQMAIHIIKGLKRKLHVVLESPTGTGKSVAILCSVLAWQRYHMQTSAHAHQTISSSTTENEDDDSDAEEGSPRIIYCSRTHSQVTQMVASLKKTPYRPRMTILGSRERFCIHKELTGKHKKKSKIPINLACQARRQNTESDRRRRLKALNYDDNDPQPDEDNDNMGDDNIEVDEEGDNQAENEFSDALEGRRTKSNPTCPHYRQLTTDRTASMVFGELMGSNRIGSDGRGCCGSPSAMGGEESVFGVHDMEDLVQFGKNPYKVENIAVYRGSAGKFGFLVNDNHNHDGETTRGCHVASLVAGGAAEFEARLHDGDKILRVNGKDVRTWNKSKVVELIGRTPNDQPARLSVLRATSDTPEVLDPEHDLTGEPDEDNPEEIYSEHSACPYYLSRAIQAHAELTFAPYNYILDPSIRRVMGVSLKNAVVVLDEAHNVESTLCEGGSGKYGEMDLYQLVGTLIHYSRRTTDTGDIVLINSGVNYDAAKVAHELLLFVENIIFHLQNLRQNFETSPGRQKLEDDYKKYRNTADNHEIELSYDGPTGFGIKGAAVGCQPFLSRLGITKENCVRLLELAESMEKELFGGNSKGENANHVENDGGDASNVLTVLVELLSKLVTATENPEHYYISCVVQANGNLDHAFGFEEEDNISRGQGSRRFKKKPRRVPFVSPRSENSPKAFLHVCQHDECRCANAVRHGDYCNGSTPPWECHLVLRLLSPGLLMRDISHECRSVVLASGSLAPLPSVCAELNLFGKDSSSCTAGTRIVKGNIAKAYTNRLQTTPKPLEANHVVNLRKQLLAVSIGHFPNGETLTVSYSNYHKNPSFLPKFGHAVASVLDGIPKGGCLVFFPSYSFLNKCVSCWIQRSNNYGSNHHRHFANRDGSQESNFVWDRFLRSKGKVIVEPTGGQEDFERARDEFRDTIKETGSCILLAVFRGKMSEGIDFNDDNARAVICIGMPLPNWTDRSVKAKQAYNEEQRKLRKKTCLLPGRDFYNQQAYRAIAQALGRCIRHGADYGTVILMDSRHCYDGSPIVGGRVCRAHANLPKWMRDSVKTLSMYPEGHPKTHGAVQSKMLYGGYGGLKREMRQFFARAPAVSREVLEKWKADREKATLASSRGSDVIFHSNTGNWTATAEVSSQQ